ncbi:MAG: type 1 glutamine amidotransferase domain-containing protein [Pseudomonadota bacterium]
MAGLTGKTVALLATNGFEESELFEPRRQIANAGADVVIVSLAKGEIKGWNQDNWGKSIPVDKTIDEVSPADFDALVLPGGQINPDLLRVEDKVIAFVRDFYQTGKPLAAICHAPWLLIEAGIIEGRRATSYHSIKTDMKNAGADWVDEPVVADEGLITSRKPDDLEAFGAKIIEEIQEGVHHQRAA